MDGRSAGADRIAEAATAEPAGAEKTSGVRQNRVLAGLPPTERAALARHLHVVSLDPGTVLQHQGHPLEHVYFPHDGLVSLLAMTANGGTIEVASVGCAGAVCPLLERHQGEAFLTAIAQGPLRVSRIVATQLQAAERQSEALRQAMHACRAALLRQFRQNIACIGLHSVEQRMSRWLLEAADRLETKTGPIPSTQDDIAHRLGVRRTTITLTTSKLEQARAIRWRRSRVEIVDRARLERMACGCYAAQRERDGTPVPAEAATPRK